MLLTRVRIDQLRSISGAGGPPMDLRLAIGCNVLVGPNGSGKSTVLRALELALDPGGHPFDPACDLPRPTGVDTSHAGDDTTTRIELWWDDADAQRAAVGHTNPAGTYDPTATPPAPDRVAGADGPEIVVQHRISGSVQIPVPRARCIVVPAEHQRRSSLYSQLEALLDDLVASDTDGRGCAERLSATLTAVFADTTTVDLTAARPTTMTVTTNGHGRELAELTTPELLAAMVAVISELADNPLCRSGAAPAGQSERPSGTPWVVVIDQPETGLHPAAQQRLAGALEQLAAIPHVTVIFASHSPFMIARTPATRVFEMGTNDAGSTVCTSVGDGASPLAQVVDSLFDDSVVPDMLDRAASIADESAGILVVEGDTDAGYISLACELAGRPELCADLHVAVSHGTRRLVLDALTLRSLAGNRPVCVLVDHDNEGRAVAHVLTGRLGWRNHTEVVSVAIAFAEQWRGHEWQAEDLLPPDLLARFVDQHDEDVVLRGKSRRPDGQWHWDLTTEGKSILPHWLGSHATADDLSLWLELLITVRTRMGLDEPTTPDQMPDQTTATRNTQNHIA